MTELETIIQNIKAAVVGREIKLCDATDVLSAILDHELEAKIEALMSLPERIGAYYGEAV